MSPLTARRGAVAALSLVAEQPVDVLELAVYFIVSESLTNARRYADAGAVHVRVGPEADGLLVEIVDDGCGGADPGCGTGLLGLADRVDALGGSLEVDSPPGGGTRISARVPLSAAPTGRTPPGSRP